MSQLNDKSDIDVRVVPRICGTQKVFAAV